MHVYSLRSDVNGENKKMLEFTIIIGTAAFAEKSLKEHLTQRVKTLE